MVRVSGREFNGLATSPCYQKGELSCLSCHSMHKSEPNYQVAAGMEGNQACYQCHKSFQVNLSGHTHHATESSGSLCYNCHMPYTTYGLLKGIRSHQISNPSAQTASVTGRPAACNLCHLDKSLGWSGEKLAQWFKQPVPKLSPDEKQLPASVVLALRGDAGQRALVAWHMGWQPAKQTSGDDWLVPYLAQLLEDPYAAVRYIAQRSLKKLPGFKDFKYDFIGLAEERTRARERALSMWQSKSTASANLQTDEKTFQKLLRDRDDRYIELLE
jgi:predicted CXXCH cytochrome family protein